MDLRLGHQNTIQRNSSVEQIGANYYTNQIRETHGESVLSSQYSASFNRHSGVDEDDFNMDFNKPKKDTIHTVDSKSYDYMNTEEQNFEDRTY